MKRFKWYYLLFIPAIVVPFGVIYGLWIDDGGILATDISGVLFLAAIIITILAVKVGLQILLGIFDWESSALIINQHKERGK